MEIRKAIGLAICLLILASPAAMCSYSVALVEPCAKVLQEDTFGSPPTSLAVDLAGGEYESLQLVMWEQSQPLDGVRIKIEGIAGAAGLHCDVFRVGYVNLYTDMRPDPMIKLSGPISVPYGEAQPIIIRFYAQNAGTAGVYSGTVRISATGEPDKTFPISVTRRKFSLARPGHLPFVITQGDNSYYGPNVGLEQSMYETRMQSAWWRWGTLSKPNMTLSGETIACDWNEWKSRVQEFENDKIGSVIGLGWRDPTDEITYNPSITNPPPATVNVSPALGGANKTRYDTIMSGYNTALTSMGWAGKSYFFVGDERETPEDIAKLAQACDWLKAAAPNLKTMITTTVPVPSALVGKVDAYVFHMQAFDPAVTPAQVSAAGGELWMYTVGTQAPSLLIQDPYSSDPTNSAPVRYWPWLAERYGVKGLLNWCVVNGWTTYTNPAGGSGGEGQLFYHNTDRSGDLTSLRAEAIRDGLEDYEYIYQLKQHSTPQALALLAEARNIVPGGNPANFPTTVNPILDLKSRIGIYLDSVTP